MKKCLVFLMSAILLLSLFPAVVSQAATISDNDVYYQYTPEMIEKTYRYLDEMYIEKYPELGLRWLYGTEDDKQVLQKLSDLITKGCTTDRQKVDAIAGWIERNIEYTENAVPYAIDTFYERETNCLGYAHMLMTLARLEGIPAIWGDGVRADTTTLTIAEGKQMRMEGHAWCFVYVDGQWLMYDILWEGAKPVTDRDYIARNYVFDTVELITPAFDANDLPPMLDSTQFVYLDGRVMQYANGEPSFFGGAGILLNGHDYHTVIMNAAEPQYNSYQYLDDRDRINDMIKGEALHGGWLGWSEETITGYAYENGILASSTVMERNDNYYWLCAQRAFQILAPKGTYQIAYGQFIMPVGYSGQILKPCVASTVNNGSLVVAEWTSETPEIATVDQNGVITNHQEGSASFRVVYREQGSTIGGTIASIFFQVHFQNIQRTPDYSDNIHVCSFKQVVTEASCTEPGEIALRCSCGKVESTQAIAPLGHAYGQWQIIQEPTQNTEGLKERFCQRCSYRHEETIPATGESQDPSTPSTEATQPTDEPDSTVNVQDDFLNPEAIGMDTLFVSPENLIFSVPKELLDSYQGVEIVVESNRDDLSAAAGQLIMQIVEPISDAIALDIAMLSPEGEPMQPIDVVLVSVPMPEGWSSELAKVYFVNLEENYAEDVVFCVSDDGAYIRFIADHFSCYTLVQTEAETIPEPDPGNDPVRNEDPFPWVIVAVALIVAVSIPAAVIAIKKRKKSS